MADEIPVEPADPPATSHVEVSTKTETVRSAGPGAVSADSRIFGVSILAICLMALILTICGLNIFRLPIYDHLVTLSTVLLSFYAGQKSAK